MCHAVRVLLKTPGFTSLALLTLALGIGANTAVFSVVNAVLLRPLPFEKPQEIVAVWEQRPRENSFRGGISALDFVDWRRMSKSFSNIALYDSGQYNLTGAGDPERIPGAAVSPGFLEALGLRPHMGRVFDSTSEQPGHNRVVLITYGLWQRRFGSDPAVVGKSAGINGEPFTIAGVLPKDFRFPFAPQCDLLVPALLGPDQLRYRGIHMFSGIARLKTGVTLQQARAEMALISKQLEQQYPDSNVGHAANLIPLQEDLSGTIKPALLVLLGAVFLVVLIACANVANLLLARASVRRREMALRAALGCSRWRLAQQSLLESALLGFAGAGAGILLAMWGLDVMRSEFFNRVEGIGFFSQAGLDAIAMDWRVLLFTLTSALVSVLLFGVSPAMASAGADLNDALRSGGRGSAGDRGKFRSVLIVGEVAIWLLLLTGAGLLAKSFLALMNVNPGFRAEHVLAAGISLPESKYRTTQQAAQFHDALLDRAAALPGVRSAALTDVLPLSGDDNRMGIKLPDREPRPGEHLRMNPRLISAGYLATMGIPLLAGREFTATDTTGTRPVGILSETAARRYWPDGSAVGKRFAFNNDSAPWIEIIGVVGAIHNQSLDRDPTPDLYLPYRENPYLFPPTAMTLVLRTVQDEAAVAPAIRDMVRSLDRSLPVSHIRPMGAYVGDSSAPQRFNVVLLGTFAGIALLLATAGLYGVMSYLVNQRTSEIGIRMALGARPLDVLALVVRKAMLLAGAGVVLGMIAAMAATRLMSSLLFGVQARDPMVFAVAPAILIAVAMLASYIPARRASRVDPLVALRME
jgi:putative ABC transport system permease protein